MNLDLGLDIVEIARVRALARRQPKFLARVFSAEEISYCQSRKRQWQHFAVRFAAKEAVWKALGRDDIGLRDIAVTSGPTGKPRVLVKGRPQKGVKLSLSHSERYAVAVALRVP